MAKCVRCRRRKAKRHCPALRDDLCSSCCGQYREKEIPCPPSCRFLTEHLPYQEEKTLRQRPAETSAKPDEFFKDERMAWLALHAEAPLLEVGARRPEWTDGDAIQALEYAREKIGRGRTVILLPGEDRRSSNPAGEAVVQSLEKCRFERTAILASGTEGYSTDEKLAVLDHVLIAARSWTQGRLDGRTYLDRLRDQFAKFRDESRQSKIITG